MLRRILRDKSIKRKLNIIFGIILATTVFGATIGVTAFSRVQVGGNLFAH